MDIRSFAPRVLLSLPLSLLLASGVFAYHGIPVTILGTTSPDALVTIRVPKLILSIAKVADEEGYFIVTFNDVPSGVYELSVSAIKDGSANETGRLIGVPDSPAVTQMSISDINLPLAPVKPIKKGKADLNGDDRVNLVDLSILLYWWSSPIIYRSHNAKAYLNGDEAINLKDVSLMLTKWTN